MLYAEGGTEVMRIASGVAGTGVAALLPVDWGVAWTTPGEFMGWEPGLAADEDRTGDAAFGGWKGFSSGSDV